MSDVKPEIKISKYWFMGDRLHGEAEFHPVLGACRDGFIQTSPIVRVETVNSVYVLDGPPIQASDFKEKRMIRKTKPPEASGE